MLDFKGPNNGGGGGVALRQTFLVTGISHDKWSNPAQPKVQLQQLACKVEMRQALIT